MNNDQFIQERSKPEKLVLLFVAAYIFLSVLQHLVSIVALRSFSPTGPWIWLIQNALHFPLWMPCVVWLASRSGRITWSTWVVPTVMLFLLFLIPQLISIGLTIVGFGYGGLEGLKGQLWWTWDYSIKPSILTFVLLVFFFRASTLHLRPVESQPSLHRLQVLTILLLTVIVAVCLSVDAVMYQRLGLAFNSLIFRQSINFLFSLFALLGNVILWFSFAWLLVVPNPKRWIGLLGIALFLFSSGLLNLLIYPWYATTLGSQMLLIDSTYYLFSFIISIFHAGLVFLCVGSMRWAGYRWDFYRPSTAEGSVVERRVEVEAPPMIVSRIEI